MKKLILVVLMFPLLISAQYINLISSQETMANLAKKMQEFGYVMGEYFPITLFVLFVLFRLVFLGLKSVFRKIKKNGKINELTDEYKTLLVEKKRELDAKIKVIKEMEVAGLRNTASARNEISKLKKDFEIEVKSLIVKSDKERKIQVLKNAFEQGIVSKEEYEYRVKIKEELTPKYKKILQDKEFSVNQKIEHIRNSIAYTDYEREEEIRKIKENYAQKVNELFELSKKEEELTPKYKKMLQDEEFSVNQKIGRLRSDINIHTIDKLEGEKKIKKIKENYAQKVNELFELSREEMESKKEKS